MNDREIEHSNDKIWPATTFKQFTVTTDTDSKYNYESLVIKYANAWQVFITHSGKIASWICASADTPHSDVYSVKTLLGNRLQEHHAVYARTLIKILCDSLGNRKQLELDRDTVMILGMDVHDDTTQTFKQITEQIKDMFLI
ncbi:uncharacterized protein BBOV_IV011915 [Babesia bovis T2Bo]|uniref:uncharacterized protein n=1 Tax=Babesia bovis T2Bo TaxID=484906 RepID=UPI001DBC4890|nr:uncharacterized protein BBOV_IV011915 [Babesia bovis T2Bo]KAG6439949.1 hypothetical protein BBOV_IV011915 [Babesia bovis T2Bo]